MTAKLLDKTLNVVDAPPVADGRVADRMRVLGTEGAFEILGRARAIEAAGRDVIHLEIGEPSFPTPEHVVEAGIRSLRAGETRYGPPQGLPDLRNALSEWFAKRGVVRAPDDIVVTPGTKPALFYATLALVNPGDEVLVPDPGFPIYASVVRFAGGVPVSYGFIPDQAFAIDVDEIAARITPRTRVLILNSPQNPTGSTADAATLERIAELVLRHDLLVISDEVYSRLLYDDREVAPSIAQLPGLAERTVIADGFSKSWSMTGWRLGCGAMPRELARRVTTLVVNAHTCTPPFVQRAGIAALTGPQDHVTRARQELRRRRELLVAGLRDRARIPCAAPTGAFYVFADVTGLGLNDVQFANQLLDSEGVATLAGSSFGKRGVGYLRLSFGTDIEKLAAALERISRFCDGLRQHQENGRHART